MQVLTRPFMKTGSLWTPKTDRSEALYLPFWHPTMIANGGSIVNGTGTLVEGSPFNLVVGANTLNSTGGDIGKTFIVTIPEGGVVTNGSGLIVGAPVTVLAGIATTITVADGGVGSFIVTASNIIRSKDKNNIAATIVGATWGITGKRLLDGTDDTITVPHSAGIDFGLTSFYEVMVFKLVTKDVEQNLVNKMNGSVAYRWNFWISTGNVLSAYIGVTGKYLLRPCATALSNVVYQQVICHVDRPNNTAHIYYNGALSDGDLTIAGGFTTTSNLANTNNMVFAYNSSATDKYANFICVEHKLCGGDITAGQAMRDYQNTKARLGWLGLP